MIYTKESVPPIARLPWNFFLSLSFDTLRSLDET